MTLPRAPSRNFAEARPLARIACGLSLSPQSLNPTQASRYVSIWQTTKI